MESEDLKARLDELAKTLAAIEVSSDMHAQRRAEIAAKLDGIAADGERDLVAAVRAADDVDLRDGAARLFRQLAITNSWLDRRDDRTRAWIDRAAELVKSDVLRDLIQGEQNRLRDAQAFAGISAMCQQGLVDKARRELVRRRKASADPVLRKRIDEVLADPRNFLGPLRSAPGLMTMNGFGTMMWGERSRKADGTYVSTLCLVFCFLPLLPLRSYLVSREGNGWRYFGRVPLSPFAFWYRRIAVLGPILAGLAFWGWESLMALPFVKEERAISSAVAQSARRNYAGAMTTLANTSYTQDAARSAKVQELVLSTLAQALSDVKTPADALLFFRTVGGAARRVKKPLRPEGASAAQAALARFATDASAGKTAREFLWWMREVFPDLQSRLPDLAAETCRACDSPVLLAGAADLFAQAGHPCPSELVARLRDHLLRSRHESWNADVLSYLKVAGPDDARPLLYARVEAPWKGEVQAPELLDLKDLPEPLRALLTLDLEKDPAKQAAGLEKAADPGALAEPQKSWHRLGAARRLVKVLGLLNEQDPLQTPLSRIRSWAVQASELAPEDAGLRVLALRYLLEDGDLARVIELGTPRASDSRTATLVGVALARSGKPEEAARLLRPIVTKDFPDFVAALQAWEKAAENKSNWAWRSLEQGTADQSFIGRLNRLPKDQASAEAQHWVQRQVDTDPHLASLKQKWKDRVDIHPAAGELAMIELSLGRSMPPGAERQARLVAAEHLFLELRKILRGDPHQELQLGQVYFWLGKDKEGTEIFDRIESGKDPKILHQLGEIYREFARFEASRRVLEKAFEQATGDEKSDIASTRALASLDSEDRLLWLRKCKSTARVRSDIDLTEAEQDLAAGNFGEAVPALKRVVSYYASVPEDATTLNNSAVAYKKLACASGDLKYLIEGLRQIRRAQELAPEDAIILSNCLDDLQQVGYTALAGQALRADLLHEIPARAWMEYILPAPSPEEWARRVKAQPELRRSAELAPKLAILSPDADGGYETQRLFLYLCRDAEGLRRLREAIEANPPPAHNDEDSESSKKKANSETGRKSIEKSLSRWQALLPAIRKSGHAPTLAYALVHSCGARIGLFRVDGDPKFDLAFKDAEEAVAVFNEATTRQNLAWVRMEAAAAAVAAQDPEFARWRKAQGGISSAILLPAYVRKHPEAAVKLRERDDVQRALRAAADLAETGSATLTTWLWLDMGGDDRREKALASLKSDPAYFESFRVSSLLYPWSADQAIRTWFVAQAWGEKDIADKVAARARANGVFAEFFKE